MKYHNIKKLKEQIDNLNISDWEIFEKGSNVNEYLKDKDKLLNKYFGTLPDYLYKPIINNSWNPKIYRARPYDEIEEIDNVDHHGSPPPKASKTLRANLAGFPVFYASSDGSTSIHEYIQLTDNDFDTNRKYCLSVWQLKQNINYNVTPFLINNTNSLNPYKAVGENILNRLPEKITDKNEQEKVRQVLMEISKLFTLDKYHSISSYISHKYLYHKDNLIDILVYPSIIVNKKTINFAIHPKFEKTKMVLKALIVARVIDKQLLVSGEEQLKLGVSEFCLINNDKIELKKATLSDKKIVDKILDTRQLL